MRASVSGGLSAATPDTLGSRMALSSSPFQGVAAVLRPPTYAAERCHSPRSASRSTHSSLHRERTEWRLLRGSPRSTRRCRPEGCRAAGSPRSWGRAGVGKRHSSGSWWPAPSRTGGGWRTWMERGPWRHAIGWPLAVRGASGSSGRRRPNGVRGVRTCFCGAVRSAWWCWTRRRCSRGRSPSVSPAWPRIMTPRSWWWMKGTPER